MTQALLCFHIQVVVLQSPEYLTHMVNMHRQGGLIHKYVINVGNHILAQHVSQHVIYE